MNLKIIPLILFFSFSTSAIAADVVLPSVVQGAKEYDWDTCLRSKAGDCLNGCLISEDRDCGDKCKSTARDKCIAEGLKPPSNLDEEFDE